MRQHDPNPTEVDKEGLHGALNMMDDTLHLHTESSIKKHAQRTLHEHGAAFTRDPVRDPAVKNLLSTIGHMNSMKVNEDFAKWDYDRRVKRVRHEVLRFEEDVNIDHFYANNPMMRDPVTGESVVHYKDRYNAYEQQLADLNGAKHTFRKQAEQLEHKIMAEYSLEKQNEVYDRQLHERDR